MGADLDTEFGPYRLVRRLGVGGMAETFLALRVGQAGFEQRICLKRILRAFEDDAEFVRLFLEEARLSATLRHQNVAQVLDFGVVDESHYMMLELIEGCDLRQLLRARKKQGLRGLSSGLVSHLAFELGSALEFAHGQDVVHRDISPSNVLLSISGEVKLSDFGIAKAMSAPKLTASGVVKGKVPYMAPEYARLGRFNPRSDLFSLGVALYECLAGIRPYDGVTDLDTLERSSSGKFLPLSKCAEDADPALVRAIERLLLPEPDERFEDAGAFLDAIADVDPPPTAPRELGELVREHMTFNFHVDEASELAAAATALATPRGTMVMGDRGKGAGGPDVRGSRPDAETRTVLPSSDQNTEVDEAIPETAEAATRKKDRGTTAKIPKPALRVRDSDLSGPMVTASRNEGTGSNPKVWMAIAAALFLGLIALGAFAFSANDETPNVANTPTTTPAAMQETRSNPPAAMTETGVATMTDTVTDTTVTDTTVTAMATDSVTPAAMIDSPMVEPAVMDMRGSRMTRRPRTPVAMAQDTPMTIADAMTEMAAETMTKRATSMGENGTLRIVVHPFGRVWVDGRSVGGSPTRVSLSPGVHTIGYGRDGVATERRRIRVAAGETRSLTLRFD